MKLTTLTSLTHLVAKFRPEEFNFLEKGAGDRASQLYTLLLDTPEISENDAMLRIYKEDNGPAFRKLKNRYMNKLFSMILFVDLRGPKYSDVLRAITECHRQKAVFYILVRFSQMNLAVELGEKLAKRATMLDQVEIALPVMQTLRLHFAGIQSNYKKSLYYADEIEKMMKRLQDRYFTEKLYCDILTLYAKSRSSHVDEITQIVDPKWNDLIKIQKNSDSYTVQRRCFSLKILYSQIIGDIESCYQHIEEAIHYFQHDAPIQSKVIITNYFTQKLILNVRQRNYDRGLDDVATALQDSVNYSRNWNLIKYLHFLLCIQCKVYDAAISVFEEIKDKKNQKNLLSFFKETYDIAEAYNYIIKVYLNASLDKLSPTRYINNMPNFSKDKQGNNVPILVAHFILLCIQDKQDQAVDRIDALKQYAQRHLRDGKSQRALIFTKMLGAVVKGHFHPVATSKYAQRYLKQLEQYPSSASEQAFETEIIPYEDLWDMLLDILGRR